ncbi:MAG: hypothetical protein IT577_19950 [Verrucomicrobiae bacterium]|nr:hypothetical protein [Verrucomicrobiae bacterium]
MMAMALWWTPATPVPAQEATHANSPPPNTRILKIIHGWPDDPKAQDARIGQLKAQGFGGAVCNVAFDGYLENEMKWQSFLRAVRRMKEEGFALWLYDEKGYPSGTAGGIVLRDHPEWAARGLLIADAVADGGQRITLESPPGRPVLAKAFPIRDGQIALDDGRDLSESLTNGKLDWTAPQGRWHAMIFTDEAIFEGTHAALNVYAKQPYVNLLLAEPIARFLDITHDAYARRLGPDLGKIFESTFTDEPSLMSCFLRPMPWRVLAWSQTLPEEFERRRGRPLVPLLPALVAPAGPGGEQARYEFWQTVAELVSDNFFGQIQRRCAQHNIPSGGHLLIEESVAAHVPFYGDFFRCMRRLDAPSIDCLTSLPDQVPWHIARYARSAADLEGKTLVMCEASDHSQRYRPEGDKRPRRDVSEAEIRGSLNRLFAGGVNVITSYFSFAGLDDSAIRRLNEWTGRCCSALRGTRSAALIALLYPAESLWVHTFASRHSAKDSPGAAKIQDQFLGAANALFSERREFDMIDSRSIAEAGAGDGRLALRDQAWRVLVLPGTDTLGPAAWDNVAQFVDSGGVVVALGAVPRLALPDAKGTVARARSLFADDTSQPSSKPNAAGGGGIFLPPGSEDLLPAILDGILPPDARATQVPLTCRMTHRRSSDGDVFLVINDSSGPWTGTLNFLASGAARAIDPATGQQEDLLPRRDSSAGTPSLDLTIDGYGAKILRFAGAAPPAHARLRPGPLPGITTSELPQPRQPAAGTGPAVRSTVEARAGGASWKASSLLTKDGADSWCFLRFAFDKPIDLTGAFGIAIDCDIPPGQSSPAKMFAYLHEDGGGDYIADLGRTTADAGARTHYLAIHRFRRFGDSKDPNARLDLDRISAISVGWGGYAGNADERIDFATARPRAAHRQPGPM